MRLGKILLALVVLLLIGSIFVIFKKPQRTDLPMQTMGDDFMGNNKNTRRGDDLTYSEELRRNAEITRQTQKDQQNLERALNEKLANQVRQSEANNAALQKQLQDVSKQLADLQKSNNNYDSQAAGQLKNAFEEKVQQLNATIEQLTQSMKFNEETNQKQIAELKQELQGAKFAANSQSLEGLTAPVLGDKLIEPIDGSNHNITPRKSNPYGQSAVTLPYGSTATPVARTSTSANPTASNTNLLDTWRDKLQDAAIGAQSAVPKRDDSQPASHLPTVVKQEQSKWPTVFPVYTIPPNTIMSDALLLTPMIGRVPLGNNEISDPFFFKAELGAENLAANGHRIPGIAKMIASGYATGVAEQQCARGYIDSMTFVFIDGRIVTTGKQSGEGTSNGEALGYLADAWGKPCLSGQYINNASSYIRSRSMAAFIEAAAEGLSQSQVSYQQNSDGRYQAIMDGNVWNFVLGRGISGSAAEIAAYVRERTANAFDVIYVPQGKKVQIMFNAMMPIDYDANARKINYYAEPSRSHRLD